MTVPLAKLTKWDQRNETSALSWPDVSLFHYVDMILGSAFYSKKMFRVTLSLTQENHRSWWHVTNIRYIKLNKSHKYP
jgi:hypothetical protein